MYTLDASSIIHAWDNYPQPVFTALWGWISARINAQEITIPQSAFEECKENCPDCHEWLKTQEILCYPITSEIRIAAQAIREELLIDKYGYHAKGVDERDIFIIATAKVHKSTLISNEGLQTSELVEIRKAKIPKV